MKTMLNMMKVERIKMKVFPTHQWLKTWCMKVLLIQKIKLKSKTLQVLHTKN
jgi:hypothetical protein